MSFEKARQLIELATMAAARHGGISLDEIAKAFECSHRTAQRMTNALERCFQDVEVHEDEDGIFHDVRTPKSEENFCELCDDVEEIMSKVFEKVDA